MVDEFERRGLWINKFICLLFAVFVVVVIGGLSDAFTLYTNPPELYCENSTGVNTTVCDDESTIFFNESLVVYGEMWDYNLVGVPRQFDVDSAGVYYNLTGLVAGDLKGFNFTSLNQTSGGSVLMTSVSGVYEVDFSMSFLSEANGGLYGFSISHDHNPNTHRECYARRQAATAVGNVGITCLIDLMVGEPLVIMIENENNARDLFIHTVNLNVVRIE